MTESPPKSAASDSVRIDKWLWAARCFKTRSLASLACNAGHVKVNGDSAKPSKAIRVGDQLDVRTPGGPRQLEVTALAEKRGSATIAQSLYLDHTPPPPPKTEEPETIQRERGTGRPSKRDLRLIQKLRGY